MSAEPIRMAPAIMLARNATLRRGRARQSLGHRQKSRRETDGIDHDIERHQRRYDEIERHSLHSMRADRACTTAARQIVPASGVTVSRERIRYLPERPSGSQ